MLRYILILIFWAAGFFLLWRIPGLLASKRLSCESVVSFPAMSVIIPARNEAKRIGLLLDTLNEQTLPPFEVIVVDDGSSDGTAALAREAGCLVLTGRDLPEGWTGKNWACWQGAQRARGELFLFLDADIWLTPDALARLALTYQRDGGLVSVQPFHVTKRLYEQLSTYFNMVLMAGMNAFTPLGNRLPPRGAFGPVMLCSRDDYFKTKGHNQIRTDILESIPMAVLFHAEGLPVTLYSGRGALYFRMYPEGFGQLFEGWTKGFGSGALSIRFSFMLLAVLWVWGSFSAFFLLLSALGGDEGTLLGPLILYLGYGIQMYWILRRIGRFYILTPILYPLPAFFFALTMLWSLIRIHVLKRVRWHDREISV